MAEYEKLKTQWKNKEISKEDFDKAGQEKMLPTPLKTRPVVVIKPGPNTTYEGLINAIDEMNINQISRYSIELPTHTDTMLLRRYEQTNNETIIRPTVRAKAVAATPAGEPRHLLLTPKMHLEMAKDVDLTSREWRDIVFEGKNKDFGAYKLRDSDIPAPHKSHCVGTYLGSYHPHSSFLSVSSYLQSPKKNRL